MPVDLAPWVYQLFLTGLDWLYPPDCCGCGKNGVHWCNECQSRSHVIGDDCCEVCGDISVPKGISGKLSGLDCVKELGPGKAAQLNRSNRPRRRTFGFPPILGDEIPDDEQEYDLDELCQESHSRRYLRE